MTTILINSLIVLLTLIAALLMGYKLLTSKQEPLSFVLYVKLAITGVISFVADTLGVGSFAVNTALGKLLKTFHDEELPAMNNGAQVIPGSIEALYFMTAVPVDVLTLVTLVSGTALGGVLGSSLVSRLNKQAIRFAMVVCFLFIFALLSANQLNLLPLGGSLTALSGYKLVLGFVGMAFCGALTSVGVGLFVMVQALLFLLNVSPLIAFPIMTVAGALQQPLSAIVFLQSGKIPLKKTLFLSIFGCLGVYLAILILDKMKLAWLHLLLTLIVLYNIIAMSRTWLANRPKKVVLALGESN